MKAISIAIIQSIFSMFVNCFKQVKALSKTDRPWQEWMIFAVFILLTFLVLGLGLWLSAELISGGAVIPEIVHEAAK